MAAKKLLNKKSLIKKPTPKLIKKNLSNAYQWPNTGQAPSGGTGGASGRPSGAQAGSTSLIPGSNFGRMPNGNGRRMKSKGQYMEIGNPGLSIYGGYVTEEFITELRGIRGIKIYEEMRKNDPIVGAMLFVARQLIYNASVIVTTANKNPKDTKSLEAKEIVDTSFYDMDKSWPDVLDEILTMLDFGWALCNVVHKKRNGYSLDPDKGSRHNDGMVGWSKIALRGQLGFSRWITNDNGSKILGLQHQAAPNYSLNDIPMSNAALFRTSAEKNNPEGKALALDTILPTPDGYRSIGSIEEGDKVFSAEGRICYVIAKSEIWENRPTYAVEFSSGEVIYADENHLWDVRDQNERRKNRSYKTLSTKVIADELNKDRSSNYKITFDVGTVPVLDYTEQHLLLDPYILGYWLGDGSTNSGQITVNKTDYPNLMEQVENVGFEISFDGEKRAYVKGIRENLRILGVLNDKHIPKQYLYASIQQRTALLQGLMDSDGSLPKGDKPSRFSNSNEQLLSGFCKLVSSLGCIPRTSVSTKAGSIRGYINGNLVRANKDCCTVGFWAPFCVHRLDRKAFEQSADISLRTVTHYIKRVSLVESRPTVCIQVDSPDNLFLVGYHNIATHNSVLRNCWRPWFIKKNLEEVEAIGVERSLAGLPKLTVPEGLDIWNPNDTEASATLERAEDIVRLVRFDKYHGLVLPFGWEFELQTTAGQHPHNTSDIISRWDQRIAVSMLADMLLIGQEKVGSYALVQSKTKLFSSALESYAARIAGVFNRHLIPRLMILNNIPQEYWPTVRFGPVETPALKDLGDYFKAMSDVGMVIDDNIAAYARNVASLPEPQEGDQLTTGLGDLAHPGQQPEGPEEPDKLENDPVEPPTGGSAKDKERKAKATAQAKKLLEKHGIDSDLVLGR